MLTLAVIGYQLTIGLSLIGAKFVGSALNKPELLYWAAMFWTVFTLIFVFFSPLIILQLVVVWGITCWIAPDDMLAGSRQDNLTAAQADDAVPEIERLRPLAVQGDSAAQGKLAMIYSEGNGVIKDDAEAVRWFRLAANQGDSEAQFALSAMYFVGRGVLHDPVTALMWANIAVTNGNETAAAHQDSLKQSMTPEEISEATRRAMRCMASSYADCNPDDALADIAPANLTEARAVDAVSELEGLQNTIADRYPSNRDGPPDTVQIIVDDAMRALGEMMELFKEADEAKNLCNQIGDYEQTSSVPTFEIFVSLVEDKFQTVLIKTLQVQTKIRDAINRAVLLTSNLPEGEGKEAVKGFVVQLTESVNKTGELHAEMTDGLEQVVVPAISRAKG